MELPLSARVIESFLRRPQAELAFYSDQFAGALAADLRTFPVDEAVDPTGADALGAAKRADDLFNALRIPDFFAGSPSVQVRLGRLNWSMQRFQQTPLMVSSNPTFVEDGY